LFLPIIMIVLCLVGGGAAYYFIKQAERNKYKEKNLPNVAANEFINVKDICGSFLYTRDGMTLSAISAEYANGLIRVFDLSGEELELFYDLLAIAQKTVSADLPEYIMENELVRAAIRTAKKNKVPDEKWIKFINEIIRKE